MFSFDRLVSALFLWPKYLGMLGEGSFDTLNMRPLFCLLSLLLLVSCKSTSLTPINTGSDPKWTGEQQYEVLVAVLAYSPETRVLFEDEMARAFKKKGDQLASVSLHGRNMP